MKTYFKNLFSGIWNLLQGMRITMRNAIRKNVTECYPEDRETARQFERFRGELIFDINENNEHKCIACGLCQMNCPNQSLQVVSKMVETEDGKKKKVLEAYNWDLSSCTFCGLCTSSCAPKAIKWTNFFEHAVFDKSKLVKELKGDSKPVEKKAAPAPAPKKSDDSQVQQ
ncbi:MAG: 4Fe-4S binding protein [Paludibacteraceae bacterium]|nr:4Fe-4S binding protein [Paludibacteraceae bacterium]